MMGGYLGAFIIVRWASWRPGWERRWSRKRNYQNWRISLIPISRPASFSIFLIDTVSGDGQNMGKKRIRIKINVMPYYW